MKLDKANAKISGVCAGMAKECNMDVGLVRLGWVAAALLTAVVPVILVYAVMAVVLQSEEV
jgi:phage shock protein PspC (stress-responsive transcriptional regulator)